MITVTIAGRKANKTDIELLTSGSVGKKIRFSFDAEWDGLSRLACFTGSASRDQTLDANNEAVIPWECLQNPGKPLIVGIYGTNSAGSVVIPTIYCNIGMIHKGATPCNETAQQATPTAVQQMLNYASNAASSAGDAARSASSAAQRASSAQAAAATNGRRITTLDDYKQPKLIAGDGITLTEETTGRSPEGLNIKQATIAAKTNEIVIKAKDSIVCAVKGTTAQIDCGINGTSYQWKYTVDNGLNWYNGSGAGYNTRYYSVTANATNDGRGYKCVVDGIETTPQYLKVVTAPISLIKEQPPMQVYRLKSGTASISIVAADSVVSYQWYWRNKNEDGTYTDWNASSSTSDSVTLNTGAPDGRQYRCKVTDANGNSEYSECANVVVQDVVTGVKVNGTSVVNNGVASISLNGKQDVIDDLSTIRAGAAAGATAVQPETGKGLFSGSYNDLSDQPTIPAAYDDTAIRDRLSSAERDIGEFKSVTGELTEGAYVKYTTGEIKTSSAYNMIKIPVVPGEKYTYSPNRSESGTSTVGYAIFNAAGELLIGSKATLASQTIDLADVDGNPEYGLFSYRPSATTADNVISCVISAQNVYSAIINGDKPVIVLPAISTAIVGHEWNLYFDNVITGLDDRYCVLVDIVGLTKTKFKLLSDCLRYNPTAAESGTVKIIVADRRNMAEVASASFTLSAIAGTVSADKYIVCIGDSLTDADIWTAEVEANLSANRIHSVGTIRNVVNDAAVSDSSIVVYNEGRAGWSTTNYAGSSSEAHPITATDRNAFYYDGAFDFPHYMSSIQKYTGNDVAVPSSVNLAAVVIGLGTNGSNYLDFMLEGLDRMIASIRSYDATVPIILSLITMPAGQDGVGNNNNIQSAADLRKRHFAVNRKYLEFYENGSDSNIHLAELYFNLDCARDFETVTESASARNPMQVTRQNNNVHPNVYGYLKFADVYYANLVRYMR